MWSTPQSIERDCERLEVQSLPTAPRIASGQQILDPIPLIVA